MGRLYGGKRHGREFAERRSRASKGKPAENLLRRLEK